MEKSEKINGKKKEPSIPANYVTLVQLQERWNKQRGQKAKEKEKNQDPKLEEQREQKEKEKEKEKENNQDPKLEEQREKEKQVEERVCDEVGGRGRREKGHSRRHDRESGKLAPEWKPKEEETAAASEGNQSEGVEKEKKGEKLAKKKKRRKNKKKKEGKKAEAENEGEEVSGIAANSPLPASVECDKGKVEEMIADEVHAPKQASAEKENVEARTEDPTVEVGRKLGGMSMNGEIRRWSYHNYGRPKGGFNHRGGNREPNGSNSGKFSRRGEPNQRSEGMVWVKKGEGSDGNVGGIQNSSWSAKELD